MKKNVVVIGASGFVGSAIVKNLNQDAYRVVSLSRNDCDLADESCRSVINERVQDGDIVVCAAAKAPAKNWDMMVENIAMITHIVEAIKDKQLSYVLNISSDAVYADSMGKISESSLIAPQGAHGVMHVMREAILEKNIRSPIGHLRPTLIYGDGDPHNGYGPNSFIRLARAGKNMELFGNGEEQRDHIFIGDVATLATSMIDQSIGRAVNAVSGKTISFMEIAELVRDASDSKIEILGKPRLGPMPHNGYRAFSNEAARSVCPDFPCKDLSAYIRETLREECHAV